MKHLDRNDLNIILEYLKLTKHAISNADSHPDLTFTKKQEERIQKVIDKVNLELKDLDRN